MNQENALSFQNVSVKYLSGDTPALEQLSFSVAPGEFVGFMGSNGAGKSTTAQGIVGIIPHHVDAEVSGEINVLGLDTQKVSVAELIEKGAGIVFQEPDMQLTSINVELEVAFALENRGIEVEEMRSRIAQALKQVRLTGYEKRAPDQMSGGQKQALCIAAALALRPKLLVLDEPTSQLDPIGSNLVFEVMKSLNEEYGIAMLVMEHKAELLAKYCSRIIVVDHGKKVLEGTPSEVFSSVTMLKELGVPVPQVSELVESLGWIDRFKKEEFPVSEQQMFSYLQKVMGGGAE